MMLQQMGVPRPVLDKVASAVLLPTDAQTTPSSAVKESVAASIPWWKRPSFGERLSAGNQHGL